MTPNVAIIIGDSTHNTLSVIRSLGQAGIPQFLILKGREDICFVKKSRYLKPGTIIEIDDIDQCKQALYWIKKSLPSDSQLFIICTFDEAATYIDTFESSLCDDFITPCRGNQIGTLFNKEEQCKLAQEVGLLVPKSMYFNICSDIKVPYDFNFPLILKPLYSTKGEKSDIHICYSLEDIIKVSSSKSECTDFVLQEFIQKEYELNCAGLSTDKEVIIAGAVKKFRLYPSDTGAAAFGIFLPQKFLNINFDAIERFIRKVGYHGPFSIEFVHKDKKDYFLEVNFRNDGLAYAATASGANLHALYLGITQNLKNLKPVYMMNYSLDYLYVKEGKMSLTDWVRDFLRTRCFVNFNMKDLKPTISYYISKFR